MRAVAAGVGLAVACLLSACSVGRQLPPPGLFDLGPLRPVGAASQGAPVHLVDLSAPSWLSGPGIAYRLAYQDAFRQEIYRDSRWAAAPAALLAERLRQRAALRGQGVGTPVALRIELEDFSQVFSAPTDSQVRLRLRAWRGDSPAQLRVFEASRPAPSPDAAGAVRGLSQVSDEVLEQVLAWAAAG